jgi:HEAT repeat protein
MRSAWLLVVLTVALASGCARKSGPVTAGGRPAAEWAANLTSSDPAVRKKAARELGHIGAADKAAVPALVGALKDKDAGVREAAVLALLAIGPPAVDAAPALTEVRDRDPNPKVRQEAGKAVDRIRGG